MRVTRGCGSKLGKPDGEKDQFDNEVASERDLQNTGEAVLGTGGFNLPVRIWTYGFKDVHRRNGTGERKVRKDSSSFAMKISCV